MLRVVVGTSFLGEGENLKFELCDKYMNKMEEPFIETIVGEIETIVGEKGTFEVSLPVNKIDTCWVMNSILQTPIFVYAGEGELQLGDALLIKEYPTMNNSETVDIINFSLLIDKYLKGEPIVNNEEHRLLCDYFAFAGEQISNDERLCNLDEGLSNAMF